MYSEVVTLGLNMICEDLKNGILWNLGKKKAIDFWFGPLIRDIGPLISLIVAVKPPIRSTFMDRLGWKGILWYLIRGWGHESTLATSRQLVTNFCLAKSKSSVVSSSTRKNARVDARWRAPGRGGVS
ncbi:hypothetical protein V6N13_072805 [Hibiscus sabdariffa]